MAPIKHIRILQFVAIAALLMVTTWPVSALATIEPHQLSAPPHDAADLILFNGNILTMDPSEPRAQAIAVRDDRILAVGGMGEVMRWSGRGTSRLNLKGQTVMPGFVDAHTHILNEPAYGSTLEERQSAALENGITTLGNLYTDEAFLAEMEAFAAAGELKVRTSLYLVYNLACGDVYGEWYLDHPPTREPGEFLRTGGVKVYADGGSCNSPSFTVLFSPGTILEPPYVSVAELTAVIREAEGVGHQVAIHAIGDKAIDVALDSLDDVISDGNNTYRHRIEHNAVIRPDQIPRYGEIGVVATLFADFPACSPFGNPPYEEFEDWEWPWDELLAANPETHFSWHGDAPFFSINPFVQLFGFVTRYDVDESDGSTCRPSDHLLDDTLPVDRALDMMTVEGAYALFRETEVGSLREGMFADMIVVSDDPLAVDPFDLKDIEVLVTIVAGETVYCHPGAGRLCP